MFAISCQYCSHDFLYVLSCNRVHVFGNMYVNWQPPFFNKFKTVRWNLPRSSIKNYNDWWCHLVLENSLPVQSPHPQIAHLSKIPYRIILQLPGGYYNIRYNTLAIDVTLYSFITQSQDCEKQGIPPSGRGLSAAWTLMEKSGSLPPAEPELETFLGNGHRSTHKLRKWLEKSTIIDLSEVQYISGFQDFRNKEEAFGGHGWAGERAIT